MAETRPPGAAEHPRRSCRCRSVQRAWPRRVDDGLKKGAIAAPSAINDVNLYYHSAKIRCGGLSGLRGSSRRVAAAAAIPSVRPYLVLWFTRLGMVSSSRRRSDPRRRRCAPLRACRTTADQSAACWTARSVPAHCGWRPRISNRSSQCRIVATYWIDFCVPARRPAQITRDISMGLCRA